MASYVELAANIAAVEKIGKSIAMSQMFGCKSEDQGFVIACDCFLNEQSLLDYQKRNDLIMGRPSIPYDAMLAAFHERGGKSRIISKTPEKASIEMEKEGDKQTFTLTWEDAAKEPFCYDDGKEEAVVAMLAKGEKPKLKSKYATPRSRAIMLFARLVSDAIRSMAPEVNFGAYTPEEIGDIPAVVDGSVVKAAKRIESNQQVIAVNNGPSPPAPLHEDSARRVNTKEVDQSGFTQRLDDPLTTDQKTKILDLMSQIKQSGQADIVKRVTDKLKKCGLEKLNDLTIEEGDRLVKALELKSIEAWIESILDGHAKKAITEDGGDVPF